MTGGGRGDASGSACPVDGHTGGSRAMIPVNMHRKYAHHTTGSPPLPAQMAAAMFYVQGASFGQATIVVANCAGPITKTTCARVYVCMCVYEYAQ